MSIYAEENTAFVFMFQSVHKFMPDINFNPKMHILNCERGLTLLLNRYYVITNSASGIHNDKQDIGINFINMFFSVGIQSRSFEYLLPAKNTVEVNVSINITLNCFS